MNPGPLSKLGQHISNAGLKSIIITNICVVITLLVVTGALLFIVGPFHSPEGPQTAISGQWKALLTEHISSADQIDVSFPYRDQRIITTVTDTNEIHRLISLIEIDEAKSTFRCMCHGNYRFTFRKGSETVATLYFHDGLFYGLDWDSGKWPQHGVLTSRASGEMHKWLVKHGIEVHERDPSVVRLLEFKRSLFHLPIFFIAIFLSVGATVTFYCSILIIHSTSSEKYISRRFHPAAQEDP